MADGTSAPERLGRLLHILPAASVEGGVSIEELARELEVEASTVLGDLTEVTARSAYHPAGSGDVIQITIGSERVSVWTTGPFRRPVKLSDLEAFCLALGLRGRVSRRGEGGREDDAEAGGSTGGERGDGRRELLRRVERHLASAPPPAEPREAVHAAAAEPDPEGLRELLAGAARDRIRCRIRYLKPGDPEPDDRVVHPHVVAHAQGRWYVVGWCERSEGARAFRLDRILDAEECGGRFEVREEAEAESFLEGGRVYRADEETEVEVCYSPVVARWVEEWAPGAEELPGGDVLVRHRVADPDWLVRHVLAYGGEAEVVNPPEMRRAVREAVGAGS